LSDRFWITCGSILAALGVAAGAIGAHLLERRLSGDQLVDFEIAVRYQMYHAIGLILVGLANRGGIRARFAGWAFLVGILAFSGGLYGWIFAKHRYLVHVIPFGGAAFIAGWLCLAFSAWRSGRTALD